jgi:hypothetical protein
VVADCVVAAGSYTMRVPWMVLGRLGRGVKGLGATSMWLYNSLCWTQSHCPPAVQLPKLTGCSWLDVKAVEPFKCAPASAACRQCVWALGQLSVDVAFHMGQECANACTGVARAGL